MTDLMLRSSPLYHLLWNSYSENFLQESHENTLTLMGLFGATHGWGVKKAPSPLNLSHISYKDDT